MPSILRSTGTAVDIQGGADSVQDAALVSVVNTAATPALVVDVATGFNIWLAAGERVFMEKERTSQLDGTAGASPIYASPVAYKA